jgi:hypothetical protein
MGSFAERSRRQRRPFIIVIVTCVIGIAAYGWHLHHWSSRKPELRSHLEQIAIVDESRGGLRITGAVLDISSRSQMWGVGQFKLRFSGTVEGSTDGPPKDVGVRVIAEDEKGEALAVDEVEATRRGTTIAFSRLGFELPLHEVPGVRRFTIRAGHSE